MMVPLFVLCTMVSGHGTLHVDAADRRNSKAFASQADLVWCRIPRNTCGLGDYLLHQKDGSRPEKARLRPSTGPSPRNRLIGSWICKGLRLFGNRANEYCWWPTRLGYPAAIAIVTGWPGRDLGRSAGVMVLGSSAGVSAIPRHPLTMTGDSQSRAIKSSCRRLQLCGICGAVSLAQHRVRPSWFSEMQLQVIHHSVPAPLAIPCPRIVGGPRAFADAAPAQP